MNATTTKRKRSRDTEHVHGSGAAETEGQRQQQTQAAPPPVFESPRTPPPLPPPTPPSADDQAELEDEATPELEQEAPAPPLTPKALVDLVETANVLAVSLSAKKMKVPSSRQAELDALQKFDANTRGRLEALAPSAIPYVQRWLGDHALVGAFAFAGACVITIAQNLSAVRALAPAPESRPREVDAQPVATPPPGGRMPGAEGPPPEFVS